MAYRAVVVLAGIILVAALYGVIWLCCRQFLQRHGVTEALSDRASALATWTFAGVAVGLVFVVMGAFVLGPWAFYRTARAHQVAVSDAAAIGWGFLIVLVSLLIAGGGLAALLSLVGVF
ncbi:MAG: hypothetical protein CL581_02420 [Alteromonadaceae bacterium]|uniref:hypothetical protein n=1 Tax=Marinobacter sp. BGYM27 TaxID=2975597 RepID=UPI000C5978FC|nr:hypothetical protein [Marinobacter sp. BGYM27]MAA63620.1 hypothetical protein [Alteromonadaceae bacterium]MBH84485.1 hypothetical protein [Alteromonadaceae bacterium]MDG5498319.1 hypothetical protein [Marinobacter sp. BGYM27]|tara:strand:- start:5062 stop:5418 length:357 start_codon:yes stop_codon:yes gene_type:complete